MMEIYEKNQFNQGVAKYKILASEAGVGSVIATKWGCFVMPLSSSYWNFVKIISDEIKGKREYELTPDYFEDLSIMKGVAFVKDKRFVEFLKATEKLEKLQCFVAIPHMTLDSQNRCNVKEQPLNKKYKDCHPEAKGGDLSEEMFTIPAIVFPRWFYSTNKELRTLDEWLKIWKEKKCNDGDEKYFVPPRDPYSNTNKALKGKGNSKKKIDKYNLLNQVPMVLICPKGHISDIPWNNFFCAMLQVGPQKVYEKGFNLFDEHIEDKCPSNNGGKHILVWQESIDKTESFGSIKCKKCGVTVGLQGITRLQPLCPGHRPWDGNEAKDERPCKDKGERTTMRLAMASGNSVYYAENFNSLYIPKCYTDNLSEQQQKFLSKLWYWLENYRKQNPGATAESYLQHSHSDPLDTLINDSEKEGYELSREEIKQVMEKFTHSDRNGDVNDTSKDDVKDIREKYKYEEYRVFKDNDFSLPDSKELHFENVPLTDEKCKDIRSYFNKISKVDTLALTCTQINFSRVQIPQPYEKDGEIKYPSSMKIFMENPEDVYVLPATQIYGEGIFFDFNEKKVKEWIEKNKDQFPCELSSSRNIKDSYDMYYDVKRRMSEGGVAKFYLLHTFTHLIIKELEFSCGYPTSSLRERLYFSDRMCGVLIYTAEGSQGSMGGLVWQGQPELIAKIIRSALERALDCSSDPICWENEDHLHLTYASCFSCAMIAENSCEERNVGLDRRVLVDDGFGFFKKMAYGE